MQAERAESAAQGESAQRAQLQLLVEEAGNEKGSGKEERANDEYVIARTKEKSLSRAFSSSVKLICRGAKGIAFGLQGDLGSRKG